MATTIVNKTQSFLGLVREPIVSTMSYRFWGALLEVFVWTAAIAVVGGVLLGCVLLTCWIARCFNNRKKEVYTKRLLEEFDIKEGCLEEEIENNRRLNGLAIGGPVVGEVVVRLGRWSKQSRRGMAFEVAAKAYFQFGHRSESEANELITRKFMRDALADYKDLRAKDASAIIDMALPLSFLPSQQRILMNGLKKTTAWRSRQDDRKNPWWWPAWLNTNRFTPEA